MAACTLLLLGIGMLGYTHVPAELLVANHFDLSGTPNGWTTPAKAFFTLPVISAALLALGWLIPILKPEAGALERKMVAYVFLGVNLVLIVGQVFIAKYALST
jgi:hypothetical protein